MSINKINIAGEDTNENFMNKKNLSKRARNNKLSIDFKTCPKCNHHKKLIGNNLGLNINKCAKCKQKY